MIAAAVIAANVEPWQGMVAIAVLAGVVSYLFKWADNRITKAEKACADLQLEGAKREAQIRIDCEAKLAAQAERFAEATRQAQAASQAREDAIRKDFTAITSTIGEQTSKSAEALTEVLARLHDRVTGARAPRS